MEKMEWYAHQRRMPFKKTLRTAIDVLYRTSFTNAGETGMPACKSCNTMLLWQVIDMVLELMLALKPLIARYRLIHNVLSICTLSPPVTAFVVCASRLAFVLR